VRPTGAQRRAQLPAPRATTESDGHWSDGHWSHGVLFYDRDAQLVSALEDYLISGWSAGATGLVIATPEHRRALTERLAERLAERGHAGSLAAGRLVLLDAATTLARFMRDGAPDAGEFDRSVGTLVRDHAAGGELRCFGEMVDVVWAEGDAVGAIELERLWSGLQDEVPFRLLCAYATAHVDPEDRATVTAAHAHRLGPTG
jgi:hypothetical protein